MAGAAMGERGHLMRHLGTTAGGQERVSCASCGGTDTRVRYRKFGSQIVECTQCGLVFVNPRHRKEVIHQRYGPEYFHKEYLPAQGVFDGRVDLAAVTAHHAPMVALLEQRLGGKGSVFEVGAGAGLFLAAARQLGWRAEGVEI